ncbi:MAG: MBL fold metallo-hydrolase [Candidatus Yanofskybacteria bacterium]|nr:MBL fold metallo-hydrolase [Candidatus Yanofskybacteria bacterium]
MQVIKFEELAGYLASRKDFIIQLGEQTGIGSSNSLIQKNGLIGVIDCGMAFEGTGVNKITTFPAGDLLRGIHIDFIILTHAHFDHSGWILPLILAHPESRVFFSKKTLELLKVVLEDTLNIQKKVARAADRTGLEAPAPLFTKQDVSEFLARAEDGSYEVFDSDNEDVWITFEDWPGWEFGFTFSGHMVGAFISLIKCPDGDGIVFSGDLSGHKQETTDGVKTISESFLEMAKFRDCKRIILVIEATYGNRNRAETLETSDARLKAVLEETERHGKQALFLVFQLNRGPNIVKKLVKLGFKVFVAGGVRKTLAIEVGAELVAKWLADKTVIFIENGLNYANMLQSAARGEYGFRPVVTSSATLDQGAGVEFAIQMLPVKDNVLISTGHVFDGSAMQEFFQVKDQPIGPGKTIVLDRMIDNSLVKTPVNVRCRGEHFDYSAHSDQSELVTFVDGLKPDMVFVNHCMEDGFNGLRSALRDKLRDDSPQIEHLSHLRLLKL